jgi:hypothetical protein
MVTTKRERPELLLELYCPRDTRESSQSLSERDLASTTVKMTRSTALEVIMSGLMLTF